MLISSSRLLAEDHDVALLDLDGVVYVGPQAVPGAPQALAAARQAGMRLAFVTNNAARPPLAVADHLVELGIEAHADQIVTSAQAAARYLADRLPGGAKVLVVGTTGLVEALRERGLVPVPDAESSVDAVVQGFSPSMDWALLAEGAIAINRGVLWVATNLDPTVPSPRGRLPGNGSMVTALRAATGREPVVTGKPDPTMHRETLIRTGASTPVVVGDRLDTDIEGANAVGCPSLLVFSGVTDPKDLVQAPANRRPSFIGHDLGALLERHRTPDIDGPAATCGQWRITAADGVLQLGHREAGDAGVRPPDAHGSTDSPGIRQSGGPDLDALRAVCALAWRLGGSNDEPPTGMAVRVVATDEAAEQVLADLDLAG